MISRESVLDPEVVPERELVAHRRDELQSLLDHYRRVQTSGTQTFIYGPQGTGKTMLARLSLRILRDERGARIAYVNCWEHRTRSDVLFRVAEEVLTQTFHRQSTPVHAISQDLNTEPDEQRWVVLDEVDQLASADVLYDLYSAPDLHLVLVSNDHPQILTDADERIKSRINVGQRIELAHYDVDELITILEKRADHIGKRVADTALERLATAADGDAWRGIAYLRRAVHQADDDRRSEIGADDISPAVPEADQRLRHDAYQDLHDHQRVVYHIINEHGPIGGSEIYERYEGRVGDGARTSRRVRQYRKKLVEYRLVEECDGGYRSAADGSFAETD